MICPLCGQRKARRRCPALGNEICAICCGTKRLVEIQCPADCPYLTISREHPPVAAVRRQQRDVTLLMQFVRDFNDRQSQLFLMTGAFLIRYEPPELQALIDDDIAAACGALAATLETEARGVIYEHRPTSRPAERLVGALKPLFSEAREHAGQGGQAASAFDRDAAVVLRRIEEAVAEAGANEFDNRRPFLELLGRMIRKTEASPAGPSEPEPSRLIVP